MTDLLNVFTSAKALARISEDRNTVLREEQKKKENIIVMALVNCWMLEIEKDNFCNAQHGYTSSCSELWVGELFEENPVLIKRCAATAADDIVNMLSLAGMNYTRIEYKWEVERVLISCAWDVEPAPIPPVHEAYKPPVFKCEACKDTGCKDGFDHDGCGAGVISAYPEPCPICNEEDKTGQVAEQVSRAMSWEAGLSSHYHINYGDEYD